MEHKQEAVSKMFLMEKKKWRQHKGSVLVDLLKKSLLLSVLELKINLKKFKILKLILNNPNVSRQKLGHNITPAKFIFWKWRVGLLTNSSVSKL